MTPPLTKEWIPHFKSFVLRVLCYVSQEMHNFANQTLQILSFLLVL